MFQTEVLIGLTILRIILPVAALLAAGEWAQRYARGGFRTR